MDGAKHGTDTTELLGKEKSGRQVSFLHRSVLEREHGAKKNVDPGGSKIKFF